MIIEDDYDAEFRYDREPVGSLQGLAPDRVVAIGTVSKSLAPALRLGWLVAARPARSRPWPRQAVADRGSPGLDQLALASLIESGRYDRHLRRMRAVYARSGATSWSQRSPSMPRRSGCPVSPPASTPSCTCRPAATRAR